MWLLEDLNKLIKPDRKWAHLYQSHDIIKMTTFSLKKIIFTHDFTHTKARIKIGTSMNLKRMQDY